MMRLAICAVMSLVAHVAFERGLELLPEQDVRPVIQTIEGHLIEPPPPQVVVPPPPEPPPPEPPKPEPVKPAPAPVAPHASPAPAPARPVQAPPHLAASAQPTAPDQPTIQTDSGDEQVFHGGDLSSVSGPGTPGGTGGGSGGTGATAAASPKPSNGSTPIGAYEATKMPLPQGRCFGKYTPEATAAGTEGTVTLDLTVSEDGRARDIVAIGKLPNGLTDSAIAALRDCHFAPGEKDGHAVAVRIRGFKIRFVLETTAP